jgi:hypothetical protein
VVDRVSQPFSTCVGGILLEFQRPVLISSQGAKLIPRGEVDP